MKTLRNDGFTLLEVLIAVVVLAFGLLAIAQMQVIAIRFNYQGRDATEAVTLARHQLELLKTLPFDNANLADTDDTNNGDLYDTVTIDHADPNNPIDGKYTRIWNVADFGGTTKSVMIVVSWLSGPNRIPRQVEFPTVISNPN
jgi:type IV pilus assembly protein PilV